MPFVAIPTNTTPFPYPPTPTSNESLNASAASTVHQQHHHLHQHQQHHSTPTTVTYQLSPEMGMYSMNDPVLIQHYSHSMPGLPCNPMPTMQPLPQRMYPPGPPQVTMQHPSSGPPMLHHPHQQMYGTMGRQVVLVPDGYTAVMVPSARPQHNQPGQVHHNPSSHYGHHQISPESQPIEKEKKRIPRPANSFMTYRTEKQREVLQQHAGVNNKDVSIIIGEMWRNEPESVKEYYRQKAEIGRQDHAIRYPDYKYTPLRRRKESHTRTTKSPYAKVPTATTSPHALAIDPSQSQFSSTSGRPRSKRDKRSSLTLDTTPGQDRNSRVSPSSEVINHSLDASRNLLRSLGAESSCTNFTDTSSSIESVNGGTTALPASTSPHRVADAAEPDHPSLKAPNLEFDGYSTANRATDDQNTIFSLAGGSTTETSDDEAVNSFQEHSL